MLNYFKNRKIQKQIDEEIAEICNKYCTEWSTYYPMDYVQCDHRFRHYSTRVRMVLHAFINKEVEYEYELKYKNNPLEEKVIKSVIIAWQRFENDDYPTIQYPNPPIGDRVSKLYNDEKIAEMKKSDISVIKKYKGVIINKDNYVTNYLAKLEKDRLFIEEHKPMIDRLVELLNLSKNKKYWLS